MRNWITGKYAVVDVGRLQTKVILVKTSKSESIILDADIFPTPEGVIGSNTLCAFDTLAQFVKDILKAMEYKGKDVYFLSSYLGIVSTVKAFSETSQGDLESAFEKEEGGKYPSNIKVKSFKSFGEYKTEQEIDQITLISEASLDLMIALNNSFRAVDLKLVCVTDENSSILSILKVMNITYDNPYRILINLGNSACIIPTIDGNPKTIEEIPEINMRALFNSMEERTGLDIDTIETLCHEVGLVNSDENVEKLLEYGIEEPEEFFNALRSQIEDIMTLVKDKIDNLVTDYEIPSNCMIKGYGGIFDIPGIEDYIPNNIKVFALEDKKFNERFNVVNKSSINLPSIFAPAIGATLNPCFAHNIDLLPKEKFAKAIDSVLLNVAKMTALLMIAVAIGFTFKLGLNSMKLVKVWDSEETQSKIQANIQKVNMNIDRLDEYILASEATDSYLESMIQFVRNKTNNVVSIASIDTKSILYQQPVEEEADKKDKKKKEDASKEAEKTGTDAVKDSINSTLGIEKESLIIRGYSISSAEVSQLYEELKQFDYVKTATITSMTTEILPSLEPVYVFEIEVTM